MRIFKVGKITLVAFVLVALVAECGREQASGLASPRVIVTFPANGATAVLLNTTVSAGFSSVMNPATINTTTFTLAGPGAAPVAGAVTYLEHYRTTVHSSVSVQRQRLPGADQHGGRRKRAASQKKAQKVTAERGRN